MHRIAAFLVLPILLLASLTVACGGSEDSSGSNGGNWSSEALNKSQQQLQAQLIGSQIGKGSSRLAFGILKPDPKDPNVASLVHDATAHVTLYKLDGDSGTAAGDFDLTPIQLRENTNHQHTDGTNHLHDDPLATVYVVNTDLDRTDWWGASLDIKVGDREYKDVKLRFFVAEKTSEPGIGDAVPAIKQLTTKDIPDIAMIDSSTPPRPALHDLTVADALQNGKPTVIAFATPAFCQTRFCGPVVDTVIAPLQQKYGARANFIHIEPYKLDEARKGRLIAIPEMQQWGLMSEPWVFVLDATGKVAAKYEGIMSEEELEPVIQRVLSGQAARN